jgi:hypothetical protein
MAIGQGIISDRAWQLAHGKFNVVDSTKYAHIVGWGESDDNRKNIYTLSTAGNAWFAGDVYFGGTS